MHLKDLCWKPHSHSLRVFTQSLGAVSGRHYCNATTSICLKLTTHLWRPDLDPMEILDEAVEKNEGHKQSLYWIKNVKGRTKYGNWNTEPKLRKAMALSLLRDYLPLVMEPKLRKVPLNRHLVRQAQQPWEMGYRVSAKRAIPGSGWKRSIWETGSRELDWGWWRVFSGGSSGCSENH